MTLEITISYNLEEFQIVTHKMPLYCYIKSANEFARPVLNSNRIDES